jgi:hypothetical protein
MDDSHLQMRQTATTGAMLHSTARPLVPDHDQSADTCSALPDASGLRSAIVHLRSSATKTPFVMLPVLAAGVGSVSVSMSSA